jgi:hypothetical protein
MKEHISAYIKELNALYQVFPSRIVYYLREQYDIELWEIGRIIQFWSISCTSQKKSLPLH